MFKINKTDISIIDSIVKQSYSKRFDTASYQYIVFKATIDTVTKRINEYLTSYKELHISLLKKDSNNRYRGYDEAFLLPDVKVFYVNIYKVSGIDIKRYLSYFLS